MRPGRGSVPARSSLVSRRLLATGPASAARIAVASESSAMSEVISSDADHP